MLLCHTNARAVDVKYATGIEVSKTVQQRLVHRQNFQMPQAQSTVEEVSVDGGNIRIRTPVGKPCDWKGYKAVRLHNHHAIAASFQENNLIIDWVNNQPLAGTLTCIGDGHDGRAECCPRVETHATTTGNT